MAGGFFHIQIGKNLGRPRLELNTRLIEHLIALGCTIPEVAVALGCSPRTIRNARYQPHIKKGRADLAARLKKKQVELALNGDTTLLIWLGKQYLDQSDKQNVQ